MPTWKASGRDAERMAIVGATGSGKTTLAVELSKQARGGRSRLVWWDTKALNDPRLPRVHAGKFAAGGLHEALAEAGGAVAVTGRPRRDAEAELELVAEQVYWAGDTCFVVDDAMGPLTTTPGHWLAQVITQGRARGIGLMMIVQRPRWVPRIVFSEAEHLVAFETHDPDDVEQLTKLGARELAAAAELRRFEFVWYARRERSAHRFAPLPPPARTS